MRLRTRLGTAYCFLPAVLCFALSSAGADAEAAKAIQTKVAQYLKQPGIRSTTWGIEVIDPANGQVLVSVNPEKPFLPASVLKVVTTAAALEKLGADFRFRTSLYTDGVLTEEGVLEGDLILVGRGDPDLSDPDASQLQKPALQEIAEKLLELGIRKVQGDVFGDDSYFDSASHGNGWTTKDLQSFYGAPISALSIRNNIVWVHVRPSKEDQRVRVSLDPPTSYFSIRNLATTGASGTRRTIHARLIRGTRRLVVSGVLPARQNYTNYVVVEKPAELTAMLLKEELGRRGIKVGGSVKAIHAGNAPPSPRESWTLLAEHQSPPLLRALDIINKRSDNLHAEMLLRVLGAELRGLGTDEAGLQVVRDFLVEAGMDDEKVCLKDGSGLSRENLLTPRFQTNLLLFLSTRPYFDLFVNTLAINGVDGTLKHRMSSRDVRGVIHAKTGSLNGVATLSGYMTTQSGRNLVFSIFANDARTSMSRIRRTIDEICSLLVRLY
ncbi:MAG: D-alanyl-D-alanine carboxypeptidase/D-alanyl-D-alanine-endopeptidase [Acidobacteria bacterium]|nr:D-alanyl-D-alanine carboxypeptidase/D-alanyl-D-alanine-endopeptidase [Acidobacteriota bacterium]